MAFYSVNTPPPPSPSVIHRDMVDVIAIVKVAATNNVIRNSNGIAGTFKDMVN